MIQYFDLEAPHEVDVMAFLEVAPNVSDPQDGVWVFDCPLRDGVTLSIHFSGFERYISIQLKVDGVIATSASLSEIRYLRIRLDDQGKEALIASRTPDLVGPVLMIYRRPSYAVRLSL